MSKPALHTARHFEVSSAVQFCADGAIEIGGQRLLADETKSYVEFRLSHGFPVTTSDRTCIHPVTVRNSFQSMLHQVFNLGHIMRAYNPDEHARDRMLGSIVGVEFTGPSHGGIRVQGERAKAPGIRAVAVMHKLAEGVDRILGGHQSGKRRWTVSMENMFSLLDCSFLVRDEKSELASEFTTPEDLLELGWTHVPFSAAPEKLMDCFDGKKVAIKSAWGRREVLLLIGGLGAKIHYQGVGLTPLGKEPEAEVLSMMASGWAGAEMEDAGLSALLEPLSEMEYRLQSMLPPTFADIAEPLRSLGGRLAGG